MLLRQLREFYFHGSPNGDLKAFRGTTFVTQNRKVAQDYADGKVLMTGKTTPTKPTVYTVDVNVKNTLDLRKREHQEAYDKARAVWNDKHPDDHLPRLNAEGFIQRTGLPSWGYVGAIKLAMLEFDSMFVDESSQGISLAVFDPKNVKIKNKA